jgi:hypothetical protein
VFSFEKEPTIPSTLITQPGRYRPSRVIARSTTSLPGRSVVISKSLTRKTPNHALEPTVASGLRRLAVPSSLRSSAAPQRER